MKNPYHDMAPAKVRELISKGMIRENTSGMAGGYVQCNLIVLPRRYAEDFREFARLNPKPCPVLEILDGSPKTSFLARGGNIMTDIPFYNIYRNGKLAQTVPDATPYWNDDMVGFLIGCSLSFEEALVQAGIEIRHMTQGTTVPMYRTNIECAPHGVFHGTMVVSMRPMTPENAKKAQEITERFPLVHGGPVHIGDPCRIGIQDIGHVDFGEPVVIHEGEVPVFWACGVTPQVIVENVKPDLAISHKPGYMFISDILNTEIEQELEKRLAQNG